MDFRPCCFANALGEPRKGFHKARIPYVDVAFWDVIGLLIITIIIHGALLSAGHTRSFACTLFETSIFTIFIHWFLCVDTTVTKFLFGTQKK